MRERERPGNTFAFAAGCATAGGILCWAAATASCVGYLAYLFSNEPLISDESHRSENERQDLQAVETGEIVGEEAMF